MSGQGIEKKKKHFKFLCLGTQNEHVKFFFVMI
jgi:hypothetical protein